MEWLCPWWQVQTSNRSEIKKQSMKFRKKLHGNTLWNIPQNEGGWMSEHLHWYQVASYPWVRATRDPNSLCLRNDEFGVRNPNLVKYVIFIFLRINDKKLWGFHHGTSVGWVHPDAAQCETKMKNNLHCSIVSLPTSFNFVLLMWKLLDHSKYMMVDLGGLVKWTASQSICAL